MKKNNIRVKIWVWLSLFTLVILCGIWFIQLLSLGIYYEWNKKSEIEEIAEEVKEAYGTENYGEELDRISFDRDVCIELITNNNTFYSTDSASRGCLNNNSSEVNNYKLEFMLSGKTSTLYKIINPRFENKTIVYGNKIDDGVYTFISASLEPIRSTVRVLKKQVVVITLIVLVVAFLIAYTISKKISKPIEKIIGTSKKISKGNYDVKFSINSDIAELKELEQTLNNMTSELAKTENLRRELLANVSHDLKTPLTLIKANAEMVRDLTYKDDIKRENNLNTITSEVDRLNLLVEDVLELSKMQSKAIELRKEEFDIDYMIKSIIDRFDVLCQRDGYEIKYKGFKCLVVADKKKIEQVIYNLINNAINYTGDNKKIYITLKDSEVGVIVSIKDTGNGIDKKDIEYIWDKYYKVDKKYKRVTYGTGLGLSIVKNILILHKFKYGVNSKKGCGTEFYFEIKKEKVKKM